MCTPGVRRTTVGVDCAERRDGPEDAQELLRVVVDRADAAALEQVGERPLHRLAVLEHVARAGGRAEVVLEHEVAAVAVADDVDPGHVGVDAAGRVEAHHLPAEVARAEDELGRDLALAEDPLLVVDVVEEQVERPDALREPSLEALPVGARDHAGDQVDGEDPLERVLGVVDGEADALVQERGVDGPAPLLELLDREPGQLREELGVVRPRPAGLVEHLVEEADRGRSSRRGGWERVGRWGRWPCLRGALKRLEPPRPTGAQRRAPAQV